MLHRLVLIVIVLLSVHLGMGPHGYDHTFDRPGHSRAINEEANQAFDGRSFPHFARDQQSNRGDKQCKDGSKFGGCGNNGPSYAQYVSANGSDDNDGLSWQTAKATIFKAMQSLPGGNATTAGWGTIYVLGQATVGSPVRGGGIWLMGYQDPNYAHPPAGWLKWPSTSTYSLKISGVAPNHIPANGRDNQVQVTDCGTQYGAPYPCVWLSGISGFSLENVMFPGNRVGVPIKIAIDSTGNRGGKAGSTSIKIQNISTGVNQSGLGNGPCVDIGTNVFWLDIDRLDCSGAQNEEYQGSFSRSRGVVTFTSRTLNDLYVGQSITVWNAADSTFNGVYTVTGVSGSPQRVATWNQTGPDGTAASGFVWNERAYAINIDGGAGSGSGNIQVTNLQTGSGGIRARCAGALLGEYLFTDADFTAAPALVELYAKQGQKCDGHAGGKFSHLQLADIYYGGVPTVLNWSYSGAFVLVEDSGAQVYGPATIMGMDGFSGYNSTVSPTRFTQAGTFQGVLVGQEDIARRDFSPKAARFNNLASSDPTQFSTTGVPGQLTGGVTVSTGKLAPDGTTGAAEFNTSGSPIGVYIYYAHTTPVAGESWVGGTWVRSPIGTSFSGATAIGFGLDANGYPGTGDYCYGGSQSVASTAYMVGDGQWFWVSAICKVWSGGTATGIGFTFRLDNSHPIEVYGPVLYRIPPNTLSDNEIADLARSLSSFSSGASPGDIVAMPGQKLTVPSGTYTNPNLGVFQHRNSARRTYTLPDTSGVVPATVYSTQSGSTNTNISPQTMVSSASAMHGYLFNWSVSLTAVGSGCSGTTTVELDAIFTDSDASTATTQNLGIVTLAKAGNGRAGFVASGVNTINAKRGTPVQYQTSNYTAGSGCTRNPTYQITPSLVQLW